MNVQYTMQLAGGHSIEIGDSTWQNGTERSVRDRWPANSPSGFSPHSSSEVPLASLMPMLAFVAQHDELSAADCAEIITHLAASIKRQHP